MGGTRVAPAIISYLAQRPGKIVTIDTLARNTGLTESQIQSAIHNYRRNPEGEQTIEVIRRGRSWRFTTIAVDTPDPTPAEPSLPSSPGKLLEVIGRAQSGDLIARDDGDVLYRVSPL